MSIYPAGGVIIKMKKLQKQNSSNNIDFWLIEFPLSDFLSRSEVAAVDMRLRIWPQLQSRDRGGDSWGFLLNLQFVSVSLTVALDFFWWSAIN